MFRMRKYGWAILSVLLIWMIGTMPAICLAEGEAAGDTDSKAVTVMIYLTGSDLESGQGAATADILEMMSAGFNADQVNVILFAGGSAKWYSGFSADACGIYRVSGDQRPESLMQTELMNMGDPATLAFFLNWCAENAPAERYDLILWDHGGGPILGVCADRLFDGDALTLSELSAALDASPFADGKALELIGFDACIMGTVEMTSVCAPYARYMIASEEVEPSGGWNYGYLKDLEKDQDGAATGKRIIDQYFEANAENADDGARLSMTCFDLSGRAQVRQRMDTLFTDLADQLTDSSFATASRLRADTEGIGRETGAEYDLVDLENLLSRHHPSADQPAGEVLESLAGMKAYHRSTEPQLTGLSVYFPYYNKEKYAEGWNTVYDALEPGSGYGRYVSRFGEFLTSSPFTLWQELITAQIANADGEPFHFTLELTDEQREHFGSASLLIVRRVEGQFSYGFIYEVSDVTLDSQGVLHGYYSENALFPTDRDGNKLNRPLTFRKVGDTFLISCQLSRSGADGETVPATIACAPSGTGGAMEITGVYTQHDDGMVQVLDLADWEKISFQTAADNFTMDGKEQYLPYDREVSGAAGGNEISLSDFAGFALRRESISESGSYAVFQLTDTQNNRYGSHPVRISRNLTPSFGQWGGSSTSERTAYGIFHMGSEGLGIVADPGIHLISPGQPILVNSAYSGDYASTRENITGFDVLVNGSFYRSFNQKDFICSIPQNDWLDYGALSQKKTVVEVNIKGIGGGGYAKDVFFLIPTADWTFEDHHFVFELGNRREYRPCLSDPGMHYLHRAEGQLVCSVCGAREDSSIVTYTEENSPEKKSHVYDQPLPDGGMACVCGAEE